MDNRWLLLVGLLVMLAALSIQAQEEPANAVQASGDVAVADEAVDPNASPDDKAAQAADARPHRASVVTGQGAMALLQQRPQSAVWLEVEGADDTPNSVLALGFTPLTKAATIGVVALWRCGVVALADDGHDVQAARGHRLPSARQRTAVMNQVAVAQYQRQRLTVQEPVQARQGDALASRMAAWIKADSKPAAD